MADTDPICIIPHAGVDKDCGSFEVKHPGGVEWFYWEDIPGRRLRPEAMTSEQALEAARQFARAEQAKLDSQ